MNRFALYTFAAGSLLASATISVAVSVADHQQDRSTANSRIAQQEHRAGDGHAHDAKGHDDHKDHSGHKDGDSHKGHPGHKEGDSHKDHGDHKDHPGHRDGDGHKGHQEHGHGKNEKRSDSEATPGASGTVSKASERGHKEDEHAGGHGGHDEAVSLSAEQIREFDIKIDEAKSGDIPITIVRPAEIKFNQDRVAHVVPRVSGVVRSVSAREGQVIEAGTVMAVLDSRELADAKSAYLGAAERVHLADLTHEREKKLYERKIYSEKRYLDAKSALAEREIDLRAASQKLRALGFDKSFLKTLVDSADARLTEYQLVAPFSGTVISRHITRGEAINSDTEAFMLADVSQLWIDITIYAKDLSLVKAGQKITVYLDDAGDPVTGRIDFVTPHLSEATRTAIARANVTNPDGRLRPGQFVKALVETGSTPASVRVPRTAIQRVEESNVVFVSGDKGLSPRKVVLGRENGEFAEIVEGLNAGEKFVSEGAFTLKAQLSKESFGDGHNH